MKKIFSLDNIISTIFVVLILTLLPYFFQIDFLNPIENTLEDFRITDIIFSQMQDHENVPVDSNIILVNIGIYNRRIIAKQIEILNRFEPKVIGVDSFFRKKKGPDLDLPLAKALSEVKNLVLVTKLTGYDPARNSYDSIEISNKLFTKHASLGFANFFTSPDNFRTVRKFTPKENLHDSVHFFFSVRATQFYDYAAVDRLLARNNKLEIINFRRNSDKYITLNARDVFEKRDSLHFIKDKIVLLGFMGPDIISPTDEDIFFTSMNDCYVGKSYPDMYGVVVHANIISMILDGEYFEALPEWVSNLFTVLLIFVNMVVFSFLRSYREGLYEPVSIIGTFLQLILVFFMILGSFYFFRIEISASGVFFAIIILKQAYETYNDSIKVLIVNFYNKRFKT